MMFWGWTTTTLLLSLLLLLRAATATQKPPAAAASDRISKIKLYVYAEGNLRNTSFLPVLMNWTAKAKACGYDGMFYADSDIQTLHLGPPAGNSGCEWCGLGSAKGFLSSLKQWQAQAEELNFGLFPLVFPFGPSDPILLQPEPTEPNRSSPHNLVEPIKFAGTRFNVSADGNLTLVDSMTRALENPSFDPPTSGQEFPHWLQDKPGNRTFVDREVKRGPGGASLRIGPGSGDGMAMQRLTVPRLRLARISFWAKTQNFSAVQYNAEIRTLNYPRGCDSLYVGNEGGAKTAKGSARCSVWMTMGRRLSWWPLSLNATQDWTHFEYTAPTWSEEVGIFLGIEDRGSPQTGSIWFDDVKVTEMALLNVVRRLGAPLSLRIEGSSHGPPLVEKVDYSYVEDPFWKHWKVQEQSISSWTSMRSCTCAVVA
jgi:hypothetical protein